MKTIFTAMFVLLGTFIMINKSFGPQPRLSEEILIYDGYEGDMYFFTDENDIPVVVKRDSSESLFESTEIQDKVDAKFKTSFDSNIGYRPNRIYTVKEITSIKLVP